MTTASTTKRSCRTCRWLIAHPDKDGKVRLRKDNSYLCRPEFKPLEELGLPVSIIKSMRDHWNCFNWPPVLKRMEPDDPAAATCQCWEKRS